MEIKLTVTYCDSMTTAMTWEGDWVHQSAALAEPVLSQFGSPQRPGPNRPFWHNTERVCACAIQQNRSQSAQMKTVIKQRSLLKLLCDNLAETIKLPQSVASNLLIWLFWNTKYKLLNTLFIYLFLFWWIKCVNNIVALLNKWRANWNLFSHRFRGMRKCAALGESSIFSLGEVDWKYAAPPPQPQHRSTYEELEENPAFIKHGKSCWTPATTAW